MKDKQTTIEISTRTIIRTIFIVLALVIAWEIKSVILILFLSFIFNAAFKPFVNYLEKYKIPRIVSTILIFMVFTVVVSVGLVTIVNEALSQLRLLIEQLPSIVFSIVTGIEKVFPVISKYVDPTVIQSTLLDFAKNLLNMGPSILSSGVSGAFDVLNGTISGILTVTMVVVISVYMIVRKDNVYDGLLMLVPKPDRKKYSELMTKIETKLGEWLRTELTIMLLVGLIVWCVLLIPGLFVGNYSLTLYALPIAFVAMIFEIIPGTGVGISAVLASIVAIGFNQPYVAVYVVIVMIVLSQLETSFIIPAIMKRVTGIDPILTVAGFFALYILFGFIGAIFVVPIMIVLQLVLDFGVDGVIDQQ